MMERKKDWIADALSELDDKYIDEAVEYVKPKKSFKYIKQMSVLVACLVLFIGVGAAVRMGVGGNKTASMEASPGNAKPQVETSAAAAAPMETMAEAVEEAGVQEELADVETLAMGDDSVIFDTMESQLRAYPKELNEEILYDMYVCAHGSVVSGQKVWDAFYGSVEAGENAQVDIMEYTVEGDPIITSINYENDRFYIVVDSSRDAFGGDVKYTSYAYDCWKIQEEPMENGDILRTVGFYNEGDGEIRTILSVTIGNIYAHVDENETWHELATEFDENEILIDDSKINKIVVINGETGERKTFSSDSDVFVRIMSLYQQLDVAPKDSMESRSGYTYKMELYDVNDKRLQTVTPYKDAVQLNWMIYDGSYNGTTVMLLMELENIF